MYNDVSAIAAGSLLALTLLVITHLALWGYRRSVRRIHAYIAGTVCIGIGITLTAFLLNQWIIAITFWSVTGPGGFAIAVARWIRWVQEERANDQNVAERIIQRAEEALNHAVSGERGSRRN